MKSTLTAAGLLLVLSSAPAWSQDHGAYLGASIGAVNYRDACGGITIPCDEKDTSWRVAGGYQFSRYLAVELGYADLGGPKSNGTLTLTTGTATLDTDSKVSAWDLSVLGSLPLVERLFAYGRAGIYRAEVESTTHFTTTGGVTVNGATSGTSRISETNTGMVLGIGLKYEFLRSLAVRAEWQRYFDLEGSGGTDIDADVLSVGLLYRF
jgi:OmpA-OmpF porin, OOP family